MNVYMFHYVHEKEQGYKYYPLDQFEKTVKFMVKNNNVLDLREFYNKLKNNNLLVKDVLLTFDDGTIDHYKNVYPILKKYSVSGTFFICNDSFYENGLLPNKIHKLLAEIEFDTLFSQYQKIQDELTKGKKIILKPEKSSYFDKNKKVKMFKQNLQYRLPEKIRDKIIERLYQINNIKFDSSSYYISLNNVKEMKKNGMYFGLHTKSHKHLEYLDYQEQRKEIIENIQFFRENDLFDEITSFAYPYGSFNEDTIRILKEEKIEMAFLATKDLCKEFSIYKIPRIDCKNINLDY